MNRARLLTLGGVLVVVMLGTWAGRQLNFDFNLSTFTAEDSQENINYQAYNKKFPMYARGITITLDFDKEISQPGDFQTIDQLTNRLSKLKGVKDATSITSLRLPERSVFGVKKRKLISLSSEASFRKHYNKLDAYPDITPKFLSKDKNATCIYVDLDGTDARQTIENIQECVSGFDFSKVYYSGSEVFRKTAQEQFSSEMIVLPSIAGLSLLALFFFFFRDARSLLVVVVILGFNIAAILLTFWLLGVTVGVLTLTVPLLILVLSFCDIVHVLYTFKQEPGDLPLENRLKTTMGSLRRALWLTSLTTFCAFAIFTISSVDQIVEFGLVTSIGIAIAFFSARYILPQCVAMFGVRSFAKPPPVQALTKGLKTILGKYRRSAITGVFTLVIAGAFAIFNFSINDSPQKNLGDEMGASLAFLNENFEGVRTIEVVVRDTNVLTENTIQLVDTIEQFLRSSYQCNAVFSINTVVKRLNRFKHFGFPEYFCLPEKVDSSFLAQLEQHKEILGVVNAITDDHKLLRIVGRLKDEGSADARERNEELHDFLRTLPVESDRMFISGHSYVYDQSMFRVTWLILVSVLLSVLMAMLVIGIAFRSVKLVFALLIPNLLPLVAALVLMQVLGIDLNPFSAMALSILLGLSIDDTIYITSCARENQMSGSSAPIESSLDKNVFPVLLTSLLLAVGFGTLIFSGIESNKNIGILVSLILLIALLSDLLILPALLRWVTGTNRDTTWR